MLNKCRYLMKLKEMFMRGFIIKIDVRLCKRIMGFIFMELKF